MKAGLAATAAVALAALVPASAGAEVVTPKVVTPQVITPTATTPTAPTAPSQVSPPAPPMTSSPAAPQSSPAPAPAAEGPTPVSRNSTSIDHPDADYAEETARADARLTMGYYENLVRPAWQIFDAQNPMAGREDWPILLITKVVITKQLVEEDIREIKEVRCGCTLADDSQTAEEGAGADPQGNQGPDNSQGGPAEGQPEGGDSGVAGSGPLEEELEELEQ